jgi:NADH-quinone oxidoreductase subunit H
VWLVAALVPSETGHDPLPEAEGPRRFAPFMPAPSARSRLFSLAARANLLVTCGVAAALFLGGWQIPGLAAEQVEGHVGLTLLGALLFVLKAWGLVGLVLAARAVLPPLRLQQALSLALRWLFPVSLLLLLMTFVWVAWGPGPSSRALIGAVMLALTCATVLHIATRVRQLLGDASADPTLDPFL